MHTKSLLAFALLSAASLATSSSVTQTITTTVAISPSQSSKIGSELNSYISSLTGQKEWSSVRSVLNTARPSSQRTATLTVFNPAITTEAWYGALPSDDKKYISSVISAEQSIMSKGGAAAVGAQPTGVMVAAGAAAMGVLGIAAML